MHPFRETAVPEATRRAVADAARSARTGTTDGVSAGDHARAEPAYPSWLREHCREQREFIERLSPYPFDQPADRSRYLALDRNDYLRLGTHPAVVRARREADQESGSGEHALLVRLLRESFQAPGVVLTASGWTANVGLLEAISGPGSLVYLDAGAHGSLADGARLAHARVITARHNDPDDLERLVAANGAGIVCIDAVNSVDGTRADLPAYVEICEQYDCALVVDEAHSFGMLGCGGGLAVELGCAQRVHYRTTSFAKALGGHGGAIVSGAAAARDLLTRVRPVLFSSATSAVLAAGNRRALELAIEEPWRAAHCLALAGRLRARLRALGVEPTPSTSQIVSLYRPNEDACTLYGQLRQRRILSSVFVYPLMPKGVSLVRLSVHTYLTEGDVDRVADAVAAAIDWMAHQGGPSTPA
jgi:CAI-1 autoinducer synthase